jgi:multiple sugar transport system permease protein
VAQQNQLKQTLKGLAFLSPWIIGFSTFTLIPIILSFYDSFQDFSTLQPPMPIGLANYRELFNDEVFWKSLRATMYYAVLAIPGGLCVSLGLAMLLNTKVPGQTIFRTIIFLPSLVPIVATALLWRWLYNPRLGLFNTVLGWVGIDGPGWIYDPRWSMPSLVFMGFWGVGHTVVIYLAGLQDVPKELYEAAEIDGAGTWGRLFHVTLPMISPVIFFNLIMSIIGVVGTLEAPYILTEGGPLRSTYMMSMFVRENAFEFQKMGYASANAWIMLVLVLILTALAFWSSKRWVHYQGK